MFSNICTGCYRFSFNGKDNDNEVKGVGNHQDYGMRVYDTRIGRPISVDPITKDYPELSPYQFFSNNPILNIDLDGLEGIPASLKSDNSGYTTAIDVLYKPESPSLNTYNNGQLSALKTNVMEHIEKGLNSQSDNYGTSTLKFIGRIFYGIADDATKVTTSLVLGRENARDLKGAGINDRELTDAGIFTLTNFVPGEKMITMFDPDALKAMNYSSYAGKRLSDFEKVLPVKVKSNFVQQHNRTANQINQLHKNAALTGTVVTDGTPELKEEMNKESKTNTKTK